MGRIPPYPKVLTYGSRYTENALNGPVSVEEKIDGSQVKFGINADRSLVMESHHSQLFHETKGQFETFIQRAEESYDRLLTIMDNEHLDAIYIYGEFLEKPKHNTLHYGRVPDGNIMIFDVAIVMNDNIDWATRPLMQEIAGSLGLELVPQFYYGLISQDELGGLLGQYLERESVLGKEKIEGIVIKNYEEKISIGSHIWPLFVKVVNDRFKERHGKEWKKNSGKSQLEAFIDSFCAEGRWAKAVQHLQEQNALERSPKDIGPLIAEIARDIEEEEEDNIKDFLYQLYIKDIRRAATRGFAEWYKQKLIGDM